MPVQGGGTEIIMIQVTIVLSKTECLDVLMYELAQNGITGATILDSSGMIRSLHNNTDTFPFMSSIREILDMDNTGRKTIFLIATEEQVKTISEVVNRVTGGLQHSNTGILFCTPVLYIEGLHKDKE